MKQINLRDYYPHYKEDKIVEVPDEVAALLEDLDRKEESYLRYLRRYGAFFTFDLGDIKEKDMPFQKSPIDILEQQRTLSLLYQGLAKLPKKQGRRIYAHYFLGISKSEIARLEHCHKSTICESIDVTAQQPPHHPKRKPSAKRRGLDYT